ncbi:hypothetical protein NC651_038145 [Populus alba x Populus x berolinensis]|nr:hypothetical protein NC651_038145 [Populus alba x Populus x berolinensis]
MDYKGLVLKRRELCASVCLWSFGGSYCGLNHTLLSLLMHCALICAILPVEAVHLRGCENAIFVNCRGALAWTVLWQLSSLQMSVPISWNLVALGKPQAHRKCKGTVKVIDVLGQCMNREASDIGARQ